jgi:hypothetical protein
VASTFGGKDRRLELIAGKAAIPLPLITTVTAAPGVPTTDVAINPAVVRVAELMVGGADDDSACAWFGTPEPPATTVTALATVDSVEPVTAAEGIAPILIVCSWKGCALGGFIGKEPAPHLQTHWLQVAFPVDWAVALLAPPPALTAMAEPGGGMEVVAISPSFVRVAELIDAGPEEAPPAAACPPPAWMVTAEPGAGTDVVAIRPPFIRVAELMEAARGAEDAVCAPAEGFPPALMTMAEPGAGIEVVAIRPSLVEVPLDAPAAPGCPPAITPTVDAVPFPPPPAITPTALAALLVVVAPTSPSLVKVVPAAVTVAFPPPPAITPTVLAALLVVVAPTSPSLVKVVPAVVAVAFPPEPTQTVTADPAVATAVVAIRPSLVNVAELIDAGALEFEIAASIPGGGAPPALTVTAAAILVDV